MKRKDGTLSFNEKLDSSMRKFQEWNDAVDNSGWKESWQRIQEQGQELERCGYKLKIITPGFETKIVKMNMFEKFISWTKRR